MENPSNQITLSVAFDYNEVGNQLYWQILQNGQSVQLEAGRETGLFALANNIPFAITVTAINVPSGQSVSMVDCSLVTMPKLFSAGNLRGASPGTYPYPSPFFVAPTTPGAVQQGATTNFGGSPLFTNMPLDSGTWIWTSPFQPTIANAGRWDTSFAMTVCIVQGTTGSYRVFGFDPETESSSGAVPP